MSEQKQATNEPRCFGVDGTRGGRVPNRLGRDRPAPTMLEEAVARRRAVVLLEELAAIYRQQEEKAEGILVARAIADLERIAAALKPWSGVAGER